MSFNLHWLAMDTRSQRKPAFPPGQGTDSLNPGHQVLQVLIYQDSNNPPMIYCWEGSPCCQGELIGGLLPT